MTELMSGWDFESEVQDFKELMNFQEYCGEQFVFQWSEVRDRIYEEARLYQQWSITNPLLDYTVNQDKTNACFPGRTKVWTAEYGVREIGTLVDQSFIVLSWSNRLGRYAMKHAYAYKSKIKTIVRIHTDKGSFDMSDDHKVMLNDVYHRRLIKAGDLKPGMSLFSSTIKADDRSIGRYVKPQVNSGCNVQKGMDAIARLVAHDIMMQDTDNMVVHHIDGNSLNNSPDNLAVISKSEHSALHAQKMHPNRLAALRTPEYRAKLSEINRRRGCNSPKQKAQQENFARWAKDNPDKLAERSLVSHRVQIEKSKELWIARAFTAINAGYNINDPCEFINALTDLGIVKSATRAGRTYVTRPIEKMYGSYERFVNEVRQHNHRVVRIEYIGEEQTYAIGVIDPESDDGRDNTEHNFLLANNEAVGYMVNGILVKNCVSYGVSAAIEDSLCLAKHKQKEVEVFRACAPWLYGGYHNMIKGRPGTGGCSMAGMMRFIAEYGVLPYDTQPKIYADGEVDWNRNAASWKKIFEKFGGVAEQYQIKVAKLPRNFDDIVACLKAGYTIPYGTNKKLVLDKKTGFYYLSGRTMHCMEWSGYGGESSGEGLVASGEKSGELRVSSGENEEHTTRFSSLATNHLFTYNKNSWRDGRGKQRLDDVKAQVNSNYFDCFVILDIERTRKSKPNFGL